jgi:hypothetical protein
MTSPQFNKAIRLFENEVYRIYKKHEENFDIESFHGRFHIIRCLILADCLYRYYETKSIELDIDKSFYAILFHDAMREDNGRDYWEHDSSVLCYKYLMRVGYDNDFAFSTAKIILKDNDKCLEEQILYDVDVLDYNRFLYLPEELKRFKNHKVKFAGHYDISGCYDIEARDKITKLAQEMVMFSEQLSVESETKHLIEQFITHYLKVKPW